jgi:trehalose synthase-fused probable maltokinase
VRAHRTAAFAALRGEGPLPARRLTTEQSNTSVTFGERLIVKLFRRIEAGPNPDVEIGEHLTSSTSFRRVPRVAGALEYQPAGEGISHLAVAQEFVASQADGWTHALGELGRFFEVVEGQGTASEDLLPSTHLLTLASSPTSPVISELAGAYIDSAQTLGRRTAELHVALASDSSSAAFAPEPFTREDVDRLVTDAIAQMRKANALIEDRLEVLPADIAPSAKHLLGRSDRVLATLQTKRDLEFTAARARVHGDYHLGQILWAEGDFYLLDFEGEPTRPLEQRRQKESPLKDVAGMLRSFSYAAYAALFAYTHNRHSSFERLEGWARAWQIWSSAAFLKGYLAVAEGASFLPIDPVQRATLLDLFVLDKAYYELNYELNNRPDWVRIPLRGILELV